MQDPYLIFDQFNGSNWFWFQPMSLQLDLASDRLYWIDLLSKSIHYVHADSTFPAKLFTTFQSEEVFISLLLFFPISFLVVSISLSPPVCKCLKNPCSGQTSKCSQSSPATKPTALNPPPCFQLLFPTPAVCLYPTLI